MYLPTKSDGKKWMKATKCLLESDVFKEYKESKKRFLERFLDSKEYKTYKKSEYNASCKVYKTLMEAWGDDGILEEAENSPSYFEWVLKCYESRINEL